MQQYDYPMEFGDYWTILQRRRWNFVLPTAVVVAIALAVAFLLPPTYRSEATIIIERQSIPQDIVATTVTTYVQEQIQQIRQRIATHENLRQIAEDFQLYPDELAADPSGVVQKLRDLIEVKMVDVQAADPDRSGTRLATIAFTVAFEADNPKTAQAVTAELANRFLDYHKVAREAQAAEVSQFLSKEAESVKAELAQLEESLAGFKQEELRQLPELMGMNLQLHERTEQNIQQTEERLRDLQDRADSIRSELSLTDPYEEVVTEDGKRLLSATDRLSALTAEYLRASARYSPEHPDVMRLSREIRVLAQQTGNAARADELMTDLVRLQEELRQARQQYSDTHPEVQRLEKAVAAVQRGIQSTLIAPQGGSQELARAPDSPRYVALQTQLKATESSIVAEKDKLANLNDKLAEYEERLYQTPVVERDFKSLSRGYDNALKKFAELKDKQMRARIAEELEGGTNAEKWVLASGAYTPMLPDSPNRIGIALLGCLFGVAAGIATVVLAEYLDTSIRSSRMIATALGTPPLAVIPQMNLNPAHRA